MSVRSAQYLKIAHSPIRTLPLHWSGLLIQYDTELNRSLVYLAYIIVNIISEYTKSLPIEIKMCSCVFACVQHLLQGKNKTNMLFDFSL